MTDCCTTKKESGLKKGIFYGLIPHTGCLLFVLASVLGLTFAASIFKPLLAKGYFFYLMIGLSFLFATLSALFYLRKHGGIKTIPQHKKYLTILYTTTILVSALLYFIVFPLIGTVTASSTGNIISNSENIKQLTIQVTIPCEGHAPLITSEIKKLNGIGDIKFRSPNYFEVTYDSSKTSEKEILNLEIFKEYPAKKI